MTTQLFGERIVPNGKAANSMDVLLAALQRLSACLTTALLCVLIHLSCEALRAYNFLTSRISLTFHLLALGGAVLIGKRSLLIFQRSEAPTQKHTQLQVIHYYGTIN